MFNMFKRIFINGAFVIRDRPKECYFLLAVNNSILPKSANIFLKKKTNVHAKHFSI